LPQLCNAGAHVIWTKNLLKDHNSEITDIDLTPEILDAFKNGGFIQKDFIHQIDKLPAIGRHIYVNTPEELVLDKKIFNYVD
jgi:hypothetical protein